MSIRLALCALLLVAAAGRTPARGDDELPLLEEQALQAAVARTAPAVVRIETVGGLERVGQVLVGTGPTTGLVVSDDGYIVSSAFNFAQRPASILVTLPDGRRAAAELVATDHARMLVLLKVDGASGWNVPAATPQAQIRVGQWAIAVGRTFEGNSPNVSVGIVSAVNRVWSKALQTDAKVSPSNYGGPLVDIQGRVLGLLVPLSTEAAESETAGVEWYDSGIGFAVPFEHILQVLPRLRTGQDLRPGLLGVNLTSPDLYTREPVIGSTRPDSPAAKAGFRRGDKIVAAGDRPIRRYADLKHELGRRYAGDKMTLTVVRGRERISGEVELTDKLPPYEQPFLGVLPVRRLAGQPGPVAVRMVWPGGPAEVAGIRPADEIRAIDGQELENVEAVRDRLRALLPDQRVKLRLQRGTESVEVEVVLGRQPDGLPPELPAAYPAAEPPPEERPQTGEIQLKVAEFKNDCLAYVPASYDPRWAHGVVIWLHPSGGSRSDELLAAWRGHCESQRLILLAPQAAEAQQWSPQEVRFIRRALDELTKNYRTDPQRIVVHGHESGGVMAYLTGLSQADVVRGVAVTAAAVPGGTRIPETDPGRPQSFLVGQAQEGPSASPSAATVKRLRELKHPVTVQELDGTGRYFHAGELAGLVRWIDALDRL
jgi:serine protease Do